MRQVVADHAAGKVNELSPERPVDAEPESNIEVITVSEAAARSGLSQEEILARVEDDDASPHDAQPLLSDRRGPRRSANSDVCRLPSPPEPRCRARRTVPVIPSQREGV